MAFGKVLCLTVAMLFSVSYAFDEDVSSWPESSPFNVLSYWTDQETVVEDDASQPCCLPKQWQGSLYSDLRREGGKPGPRILSLDAIYVDQTNQRIAEDVKVRGRNGTISYIVLFNKAASSATLYAFSKANKKCFKKTLKNAQFRDQCLPKNSTLWGTFALGAGSGALKTQGWWYRFGDKRARGIGSAIVTSTNCVPVLTSETIFTRPRMENDVLDSDRPKPKPRPTTFTLSSIFTNIQTSIRDPSVFKPPTYCNVSETVVYDPDIDFTNIIQRFVSVP